jgi:hypothetical protein
VLGVSVSTCWALTPQIKADREKARAKEQTIEASEAIRRGNEEAARRHALMYPDEPPTGTTKATASPDAGL